MPALNGGEIFGEKGNDEAAVCDFRVRDQLPGEIDLVGSALVIASAKGEPRLAKVPGGGKADGDENFQLAATA